ncbi:MAG: DMT family transporter [Paracoccaceae bacterium]
MKWYRSLDPTPQGIVVMMLAMATLSLMDAVAKSLTYRYDPMQVVWARYACSSLVVGIVLAPRLRTLLVTKHLKLQLVRSAFLFATTYAFFFSVSKLGLAEVVAIFDINPLIVTILAFVVLHEPAGPRRIFGVCMGLVGALIIIRPGSDVFSSYAILPLIGAFTYAAYVISTRFLGRDEHILTSLIYTTLFGTIAASIIVPPVWITPTPVDAALMLSMGFIGSAGQYFLIRAFTLAEAGAVAPFSYIGMLFAVTFGYIFFDELPDTMTVLGALVITGSGIYVWHRENQTAKNRGKNDGKTG